MSPPSRGNPGEAAPLARPHWPATAALGVAALGLLALFHETATSLVRTWLSHSAYGHGVAVLPIALWLAWERRHRLAAEAPRPAPLALLPFAAAALLWALARASAVQIVEQAALIGMLQWLVPAVLGWRAAMILASPLLFLTFAVPAGESLVPWLQDATVAIIVGLRQWAGLITEVDGRVLVTLNGVYEVAETCSGLRFLIAALATSFLVAELLFVRPWKRAAFIAAGAAVAILANGIRAFGIMAMGDRFGHDMAVLADHVVYGWAFLSAALAGLAAIGWALRDTPAPPIPPPNRLSQDGAPMPHRLAAPLVAAGAVALAAVFPAWMESLDAAPIAAVPPPAHGADWHPITPGAAMRGLESVTVAGRRVDRLIAVYATQRHGAEAVGGGNDLIGPGWRAIQSWRREVTIDGHTLEVPVQRLAGHAGQRLLMTWFWTDGALTGSPVAAKLLNTRARLLGGNPAAAVLAVSLPLDGQHDLAAADAALTHFLATQGGLAAALATAADGLRPPHRN